MRSLAAHYVAGGEPPLASRDMQNSQRVLLAKPHEWCARAWGARRGRARCGAMGARVKRGCNGGRARCPHRAARVMRGCNGGARGGNARWGHWTRARDGDEGCRRRGRTATPHERGARPRGAAARAGRPGGQAAPYRNGARQWGAGEGGCAVPSRARIAIRLIVIRFQSQWKKEIRYKSLLETALLSPQ